jgi:hypothetical protein
MAVGVIEGEKPRYFSIVRWGDAEITLEEAKKRLRAEKWLVWFSAVGALSILLLYMLTAIVQLGR